MPRRKSPVRAGKLEQRDRGRRKKHHNHEVRTTSEELRTRTNDDNWGKKLDYYQAWLRKEFPTDNAELQSSLASMSLKQHLQTSLPVPIDIAPDERLRQLAIHWEYVCSIMPQPKGWKILKRFYEEALKYDDKWQYVYHSMSLSARTCANWLDSSDPDWEDRQNELLNEALNICNLGVFNCPTSSLLYTSRGRTKYDLGDVEESIVDSEKAMELDSKQMWAALYRAHALHDLKRWAEAVEAYEQVNVSFFDGGASWRGVLIKDQLACCLLNAGNRKRALELFNAAINSYEANPGLLVTPVYLIEAAQGELQSEIGERVMALLERD